MNISSKLPFKTVVIFGIIKSLFFFLLISCTQLEKSKDLSLFKKLSSDKTNITFENTLTETDTFNYFLFSYIYMGGGVSVGDFNNDGLTDIYLVGNMISNKLYLNKGNLEFEDVTEISNTGGDTRWMLGSTICDINNDGLLDIYVSVSGLLNIRENLLFVNQGINKEGIPVFIEEAEKYGINDPGLSTQSTFFDYDNDGDLDLYVANYPITSFKSPPFFYKQMMRHVKMKDSDHLYRNNGDGTFTNVTVESGLLSFGLSLSATVGDLNQDGFKDIYISNDFTSPDFFYFNNGDGTFTDRTAEVIRQTSFYGMGADIADYNNDGLLDIMQIDMAPEDNQRAKENMASMDRVDFDDMIKEGLHHQYRYSTLFLNRGVIKNELPYFSNAAWIAGVTSTDWSWAALFADFDLDGWKDLYITNGSRRDINNIDYFNKMGKSGYFDKGLDKSEMLDWVKNMPYKPLVNYIFKNNGDFTFSQFNKQWNINETSYSNGVAYADLDNDGDLELIVNNIDEEALVYRNLAREKKFGNYLKVNFEGTSTNKMGIGSIVNIWHKGKQQMAELTLSRGYQSSVEPILYFGLSGNEMIDSLQVTWSDGKVQKLKNIKGNQKLTLKYAEAKPVIKQVDINTKIFQEITDIVEFKFIHKENVYDDYKYQVLLPHKMSHLGPDISSGDVNNDKLEDFFFGNASNSAGRMFTQRSDGAFDILKGPWETDYLYEDLGSLLFDADLDGDLDLYVVSGGSEFPEDSKNYQDRLYINDGKGNFSKSENSLPVITTSGSCVTSIDFDNDGDLDLFVGGRQIPKKYPFPAKSYILENITNNGYVKFKDVTSTVAPDLVEAGMVTSVLSADIDNDQWTDLVVVGEWMPVCFYRNNKGKFEKTIVEGTKGWWFSIEGADFDKDGDIDLVAGNLGLNFRYQASTEKTFDIYAADFENDGKSDIVLSYYQGKNQYPLRGRECFVEQNPGISLKFPTYESFGKATVSDIYTKKALQKSLHLQSEIFASCYFENAGNGKFKIHKLPNEAQLSSINDIIIDDFNNDGNPDILAAGNLYDVEIVTPRNDGGVGVFLKGSGDGSFEFVPVWNTGFFVPGNVKALSMIKTGNGQKLILVGNNNENMQVFKLEQ
ncbi:MAG: VCBS repeat-containing protein [Bacteroidales bacterium]|nr:VCBS repeat-containing protein [Bacteroidales bacterium]